MVHRLDAHDSRLECAIVLVHVLDEFVFRRPGPDHENLRDSVECVRDIMEESLGVVRMLMDSLRPDWVLVVNIVQGSQNRTFIDRVGVDVEYASFFVIKPNGYVLGHVTLLR
jgi:hypothetical protein